MEQKDKKRGGSLFTSECVTVGHPDKMADYISDSIVTEILQHDPTARVAVETMLSENQIVLAGEVSTTYDVNYEEIARRAIREVGYNYDGFGFNDKANILINIHTQSPDIAMGVDKGGAGDQGMMFGGAWNETSDLMPLPITMARALAVKITELSKERHPDKRSDHNLYPDAKTQVTIAYGKNRVVNCVDTIVISVSHSEDFEKKDLRALIEKEVIEPVLKDFGFTMADVNKIFINPTGKFVLHGPAADSGLTGRKIIVDTYGGYCSHGGGAFCIPKYQVISTDKGYKRIKDVNVGDTVSVNGVSKKVINKFEAGVKEAYRLHTKNGYSADMSLDHMVKVIKNDKEVFKPLRELAVGDWIIMAKTYSFGDRSVPEAYLMGYVVGDGWLSASDNSVNVKLSRFDRGSRIEDEFNKLGGKLYEDTNSDRSDEVIIDKLY